MSSYINLAVQVCQHFAFETIKLSLNRFKYKVTREIFTCCIYYLYLYSLPMRALVTNQKIITLHIVKIVRVNSCLLLFFVFHDAFFCMVKCHQLEGRENTHDVTPTNQPMIKVISINISVKELSL